MTRTEATRPDTSRAHGSAGAAVGSGRRPRVDRAFGPVPDGKPRPVVAEPDVGRVQRLRRPDRAEGGREHARVHTPAMSEVLRVWVPVEPFAGSGNHL